MTSTIKQQQQKPHLGIPEENFERRLREFLLSAIGSANQNTVR